MNIKNKIQRIVSLSNNGQFRDMEKTCLQVLKKYPGNFDALQFLGLALSKQNKQKEAIVFFKKALKINDSHIGAQNNLGFAYIELGMYQEALKCLNKSIKLAPNKAEIFNNLGIVLCRTHEYQESVAAYEKAIILNPQYAEAIDNLGICLRKMGLLHEGIEQHLKALNLNPISSRVYIHLFQALCFSHVTDDALHVANAAVGLDNIPSKDRFELLTGLAIVAWLSGKLEIAREAITQSQTMASDNLINITSLGTITAFHNYICKLLKIRDEQPNLYSGTTERPMFFVGESHCLSPSETIIQYHENKFRILSTFIQGCKAWHLGRKRSNEYKKSLEILFKALPQKSHVIVGMGEIDCRPNEGILRAHLDKGINYQTSIPEIVEQYMEFVTSTAKPFGHTLIFYNVPAANRIITDPIGPESTVLCQNIICLFNKYLRIFSRQFGWEMLDVYGLTTNVNTTPENTFHIDGFHLHPRTLGILFKSHLIVPTPPKVQ